MKKRDKNIYWIATIWLALGMASTGVVQMIQLESEVDYILKMGYPAYFLTILGIWKILGVIAILVPPFPVVKEWAYAGFFFTVTGAIFSHIAVKNPFSEIAPLLLLLVLTVVSWFYRPSSRKVSFNPTIQ